MCASLVCKVVYTWCTTVSKFCSAALPIHVASRLKMAQLLAGYAYWVNALVTESGCPVRNELPKEKRRLFRELARVILDNGFDNIAQIEGKLVPCESAA